MLVVVFLDSFYPKSSGDLIGKGEFYFKCNKQRYPEKGVIVLDAHQMYDPDPNPILFKEKVNPKKKEIKLKIEVWERDLGPDDKMLEYTLAIPLQKNEETFELTDNKNLGILKIHIKIVESIN